MRVALLTVLVCLASVAIPATQEQLPNVEANAKRADKVVIGVVEDVQPRFAVNEFGDRLIVSAVWLRIEETLKGAHQGLVSVDLEGGTIGDLTLRVSDLPVLKRGDRGVFLLDATASTNKPHSRGAGSLKRDASDRVDGTNV